MSLNYYEGMAQSQTPPIPVITEKAVGGLYNLQLVSFHPHLGIDLIFFIVSCVMLIELCHINDYEFLLPPHLPWR